MKRHKDNTPHNDGNQASEARPRAEARATRKRLRRTLGYLRPYWWLEGEILVCMAVGVVLSLIMPMAMKTVIDVVIIEQRYGLLHIIIAAIIAAHLIRAAFAVINSYLFNFVGQRIIFDIRLQLFQHLESLHMGFYHKTKTGEMISRVNNDVESLQSIVTSTVVDFITDTLTIIAILALLLYLDWRLTLVSLSVVPFFIISIAYFSNRIRIKSRRVREQVADILHFFQETLSGMKLVQSFVREKYEAQRLVKKGREMINLRIDIGILGSLAVAFAGFFAALGPTLVLWYGGYRTIEAGLSIGSLVAFYAYIGDLFRPVLRLAQLNVTLQTAMASMDRIFDFLEIEPLIADAPDARALENVTGHLAFRNVSFFYKPGEPILQDVSFEVDHGRMVAIVGPSGVGKTTIINLICRFYDPIEGCIELDGIDLRQIKRTHLRRQIGIVSQDTVLFNSSIRENLMYGDRRASEEKIIAAAQKANIHDFISSLPEGYDTIVGDRGVRLSGGEQQRLAIARAILKEPRILILDEATSSLDSHSEAAIQHALEPFMQNRTTVVIAHRLSTIVNADTILVLDGGRIVERGSHSDLLAKGGVFRRLWDEQVKKGIVA